MKMKMVKNLGPVLEERRKSLGLTPLEVAYKTEVLDDDLYEMIEADEYIPSYPFFVRICYVLGLSAEDFIVFEEE